MGDIEPGIYRHYKGNVYEVLGVGQHTETEEAVVVYRPLEGGQLWVRPAKMFFEEVVYNGQTVKRFQKV